MDQGQRLAMSLEAPRSTCVGHRRLAVLSREPVRALAQPAARRVLISQSTR